MNKSLAIIAGEPNSISSEIIFKSWKLREQYTHKPLFIIGSIRLLNLQKKKLKHRIKIKKINKNFKINELNGTELPVYDIKYNQKKPFEKISNKSNKYILKCFNQAIIFAKSKKILGFINCPISKEFLFKGKNQGITEFLSKKLNNCPYHTICHYIKKDTEYSEKCRTELPPITNVDNVANKEIDLNKDWRRCWRDSHE